MELMTSQRQTIAGLIASKAFDPMSFEWWISEGDDVLSLLDTDWSFTFGGDGGYVLRWRPGAHKMEDGYGTLHDFDQVLPHVAQWLDLVKRENAAVDPWEVRRDMVALIGNERDEDPAGGDAPFDAASQADWSAALDAMQLHLDQRLDALGQETGEFKLYVARQFELLRELLPTKSRRAWRSLLRDFLVNIAATATWQLGPAGGQVVVDLVHAGLPAIGLG